MLDRIPILPPVQPPHGDPAPGIRKLLAGEHHGLRQVIQEIGLLRILRLSFIFRRHLAGVHGIEHFLPQLRLLNGAHLERQRLKVDLPLLRFRIVTIQAIALQQRKMLGRQ